MLSIVYIVTSCALLTYLTLSYHAFLKRQDFIRKNGCKSERKYPHKDFLGLDVVREIGKQMAESRRLKAIQNLYDTYGPTYSVRMFGQKMINAIDPENLRSIFATNFEDYGLQPFRLPAAMPAIGRNIFTTDGQYWRNSRDQVTPIFTRAQVSNLSGFEQHFDEMLKKVPKDGAAFDIMPLVEEMFINSALDFLFGASASGPSDSSQAEKAKFLGAFHEALMGIGRRGRLGKLSYAQSQLEAVLDQARLDRDAEATDKNGRYVFLKELVQKNSDLDFIRNNALGVYVAGHESTAILLTNLLFVTSRRPDVWSKLRQEALAVRDAPITFELLKSLHFLQQVINETLRLYPILVQSTRVALRDTILPRGGGPDGSSPIFIQKGWSVVYNPYALHRRTDIYGEDAEEFKPERWETLRQNWHYLPFGGGPRICPAQQLALTEGSYSLFRMLLLFKENRSCDERPWTEGIKLTVRNKHGTRISLIPA